MRSLAIALVLLASSCGDDDGRESDRCTAGEVRNCRLDGGSVGIETCGGDFRWAGCEPRGVDAGPPDAGESDAGPPDAGFDADMGCVPEGNECRGLTCCGGLDCICTSLRCACVML